MIYYMEVVLIYLRITKTLHFQKDEENIFMLNSIPEVTILFPIFCCNDNVSYYWIVHELTRINRDELSDDSDQYLTTSSGGCLVVTNTIGAVSKISNQSYQWRQLNFLSKGSAYSGTKLKNISTPIDYSELSTTISYYDSRTLRVH